MRVFTFSLLLLALLMLTVPGQAQTTTNFTYQGYLEDGGAPANGVYDFYFQLYDEPTFGIQQGTNRYAADVTVTNGQFTVLLDWGYGPFPGAPRFLEIYVRPGASTGAYTKLAPRQQLTPVPYAIAALNAWRLGGNNYTIPGANFLGTIDNKALEFKVNNVRALRLEPNAVSPNILGGSLFNTIMPEVCGSVIAGGGANGYQNAIYDHFATIGGGQMNTAGNDGDAVTWSYATVAGGAGNHAQGYGSAVGGGMYNSASGEYASIPGGNSNYASGAYSFAAGYNAHAIHNGAFVWADSTDVNCFSDAADQFKARATGGVLFVTTGGGWALRPNAISPNIQAGYGGNTITDGVHGGTLSGGGNGAQLNRVTDHYGTVGGGSFNLAGDDAGTTGDRPYATVGGGQGNTASGWSSTVAGGQSNVASGIYAMVPGGQGCTAGGSSAFAAGFRAKATADGAFAWADTYPADFTVADANRFGVRAAGGIYLYTNAGLTTGVYVPAGSGTWSSVSDRNAKTDFAALAPKSVLARLVQIPLSSWRYKSEADGIRHYGPMAQDFYAAFRLGDSDKAIATVDADGVALAAIQGLYQQTREENAALKAELAGQQAEVAKLKAQLAALETLVRRLAEAEGVKGR